MPKATAKFKTKEAKRKYDSWTPIIKKAKKDGAPKATIKMMERFQHSWIGK